MKNILPDRLRDLRGAMSQSDFAHKIGVKQTSYSSWERGAKDPAAQTLARIASTFGVSTDWLLGLSDLRTPVSDVAPRSHPAVGAKKFTPPDNDVLAELSALKRRVSALEHNSIPAFACG